VVAGCPNEIVTSPAQPGSPAAAGSSSPARVGVVGRVTVSEPAPFLMERRTARARPVAVHQRNPNPREAQP